MVETHKHHLPVLCPPPPTNTPPSTTASLNPSTINSRPLAPATTHNLPKPQDMKMQDNIQQTSKHTWMRPEDILRSQIIHSMRTGHPVQDWKLTIKKTRIMIMEFTIQWTKNHMLNLVRACHQFWMRLMMITDLPCTKWTPSEIKVPPTLALVAHPPTMQTPPPPLMTPNLTPIAWSAGELSILIMPPKPWTESSDLLVNPTQMTQSTADMRDIENF